MASIHLCEKVIEYIQTNNGFTRGVNTNMPHSCDSLAIICEASPRLPLKCKWIILQARFSCYIQSNEDFDGEREENLICSCNKSY